MNEKEKTKRCCMIVYAIYPLGETRVQREAEALLRNGYEVDVICLRLPGDLPVDSYKDVTIYREEYIFPFIGTKRGSLKARFFNYLRFFFSAAARVTKNHFKNRYDVIQVHNLPDFLVFCALIPKLLGVPVILDLHDLMPEFFEGRFKTNKSFLASMIIWQERMACKFANHVLTVSAHWRQALIKRGVPADKCSVILNVADDKIFYPRPPAPLSQPRSSQFRLIYHGSIHERYGLALAVEAVDQLRQEIPHIHLTLIGQGDFLSRIVQMVEERQLSQHVTIESLHLAEELPDIILTCDLGIVPYENDVFTDGLLPTKLMEYAALGIPAVAARTTAIQAYFSGTNTEFFEPGNLDDLVRQIRYLYLNPGRLMELANGCHKFNQRYNWAKVGSDYVALVEKIRLQKKDVKITDTLDEAVWREFVDQHPQGNIFQTPEMFQVFSRVKGYRPELRAAVGEDGRVQALLLPVKVSLQGGLLKRLTTRSIAYGSTLSTPDRDGKDALEALLEDYSNKSGREALFTELRHLSDLSDYQTIYANCGFRYQEQLNYLINLDCPPDEVFNKFGAKTRKHIRRELKKGQIVVEEIQSSSQVKTFYALIKKSYQEARVPIADISLFEAAFDVLYPKKMIKFSLARLGETYIASSVELIYKDVIYGWYGGVDRAFSSSTPTEILTWHILKWGSENGFRVYDFGGAGTPNEEYGVRDFKSKFGGELVSFGRNTRVHAPVLLRFSTMGYSVMRQFLGR